MSAAPSGLGAQEGFESASGWEGRRRRRFLPRKAGGRPLGSDHARAVALGAIARLHVPRRPVRGGCSRAETLMHVTEAAGPGW